MISIFFLYKKKTQFVKKKYQFVRKMKKNLYTCKLDLEKVTQ